MLIEKLEAQRDTITNSMSRVHGTQSWSGYQKKQRFQTRRTLEVWVVSGFSLSLLLLICLFLLRDLRNRAHSKNLVGCGKDTKRACHKDSVQQCGLKKTALPS